MLEILPPDLLYNYVLYALGEEWFVAEQAILPLKRVSRSWFLFAKSKPLFLCPSDM
jgi:hypothetical protein